MKKVTTKLFLLFALWMAPVAASAETQMQALVLEAHDGARITGFLYQKRGTPKDAPIAVMMHGLTGSSLHWVADGFPSYGGQLTDWFAGQGYRVVALDARAHGVRKEGASPIERVMAARKGEPAAYQAMIENTAKDYGTLLAKMREKFPTAPRIVAVGYSMGAQMAVLTASANDEVTHIVTMVPPHVGNVPAVAPFSHAEKVTVPWLLLTANKDQFANADQNAALAKLGSGPVEHRTFDSGHVLPVDYMEAVQQWVTAQTD